jgi:hypothetical protein
MSSGISRCPILVSSLRSSGRQGTDGTFLLFCRCGAASGVIARKWKNENLTKTVLIADDSASMRLSVRLLLQGRHTELVVREPVDGIDGMRCRKRQSSYLR